MNDALNSPDDLLASLFIKTKTKNEPVLLLLCGDSGAGKTAWCQKMVHKAQTMGIPVSGLLSPPVFQHGQKVAIDLLDLTSTARRQLAHRHDQNHSPSVLLSTTHWIFDQEVAAWGDRILEDILHQDSASLGILVIDELGPLEFERGIGLVHGLELIDSRRFQLTCLTVRPSLLQIAQERWPWGQVAAINKGDASGSIDSGRRQL